MFYSILFAKPVDIFSSKITPKPPNAVAPSCEINTISIPLTNKSGKAASQSSRAKS